MKKRKDDLIVYLNFGISLKHYNFIETFILKRPRKNPQQIFDRAIYEGLIENKQSIISLVLAPISTFPETTKLWVNLNKDLNNEQNIHYIPFVNLPILKQISVMLYCIYFLTKLQNKNKSIKLLLNWPYFPYILSAHIIRKVFKNKVFQIVPDFPDDYFAYKENKTFKEKIYSMTSSPSKKLLLNFDGYILLTDSMRELIKLKDDNYVVVEGLISPDTKYIDKTKRDFDKVSKIKFMYAGSLNKKVGILTFVNAFLEVANTVENIELYIYGSGDTEKILEKISSNSSSVYFEGVVPRTEVLGKQIEVDFLINPRPLSEEYTKYSFPSKTLEYMLSGTPLISTKLEGIPFEYEEYIIFFEKDTVEGMVNTILKVLTLDKADASKFGKRSREWIINNKNPKKQTQKIINLLNRI